MKSINLRLLVATLVVTASATLLFGQSTVKPLLFGDMNQWITREVKESAIIGGNTKEVFEIGPTQVIKGFVPYTNQGGSPWATSNVLAKVAGVVKTNTSVFPEVHDGGFCARLNTRMESVKVLGLVDITVLAAGSVFLGSVHEPIKSTKNPNKMLQMGIPFTERPTALQYDYKVRMADSPNRIKATGFGSISEVAGKDHPATILALQQRWEDEKGAVYANRIATLVIYYDKSTTNWQKGVTYQIHYGDITKKDFYKAESMALNAIERFTMNSKGESVLIQEVAWGHATDTPTHLMLQFTSSHGGAYIGSPGNSFWIDNVKLIY